MKNVDGIILVLSCQKYKNSRLKEFKLTKDSYCNDKWAVIYVVGDLSLEKNYVIEENIMTIKCEDSYIHLLKKLVLATKYCFEEYSIKEGILRCGDDLIIDDNALENFLNGKKYDFYGQSDFKRNNYYSDKSQLKKVRNDNFMVKYYHNHPEDFDNPNHNLKGVSVSKYTLRPHVWGPHGIIYYISKKACKCLIKTMEEINYNIFHFDHFTQSYPYTIEDCAVTYILYKNDFTFTDGQIFFDRPGSIAKHTNKYRDTPVSNHSQQDLANMTVIGSEGMGRWGSRIINYFISKINNNRKIIYKNVENCNFIVKSHFNRDEPLWNNSKKPYLLWSGEAYTVPETSNASKFLHIATTFLPNSIYVPYVLDSPYLYKKRQITAKRPNLVAYCSSNSVYIREVLFNKFVEKNKTGCHALGKCYGGKYLEHHRKVTGTWSSNDLIESYKKYKFAFAIENKKVDGYVTEKIMNAFYAGCIPIYWGSSNVNDLFNKKSFINVNDFNSLDECVDYVCNLSDEEINIILNEPIYNPSSELIRLLDDEYNSKNVNKTLIRYLQEIIKTLS